MVGAVGEMASMKRRMLWKTGEDGLCCSSSAIQTRLDPSSLLEERSETPIVFVCFFCVVGYLLWNRGGTVSRILCCMVAEVVLWTRHHLVSLTARNIPKKKKKFADQLSHSNQVLPMEWSLLPRVFQDICKVFGHPHLKSLWHPLQCQAPALLLTSSGPDGLETECVPAPLGPSVYLCLPAVWSAQAGLVESASFNRTLVGSRGPLWSQKEWFADLLSLLVDKPLEPPQL